jgi:DNA-binding MarR family transcriptional regulator
VTPDGVTPRFSQILRDITVARRKPLELDRFLPYRLSVLSNVVSTAIAGSYQERFGLTIPEWRVMAVLAMTPGLSAAEVAERTAMDKVAVSRAVTSLLRQRRIARQMARADRRRSLLRLSVAGERVYAQVVPFALAYERDLLNPLSRQEWATVDRALHILLGRAKEIGPARNG